MQVKRLEFIQSIIARLAGNSFQMKAWGVALASAAIGFAAAKDSRPWFAVLAVVPGMAFWALDAYYLGLERRYVVLYGDAMTDVSESLALNAGALTLQGWADAATSVSVAGLHIPMLAIILAVSLL